MTQTLLYQYGTTTYDLGELPDSLYDRLNEESVAEALHAYLDAHDADKAALEAYEDGDQAIKLLRNYTLARKQRKKSWDALVVLLDEE